MKNKEDTKRYLVNYLKGSFLYTELFSAYLAFEFSLRSDYQGIEELCLKLRAIKSQKELREASEKLGSRLVKTLMRIDLNFDIKFFKELNENLNKKQIPICHSVAYGAICALAEVDKDYALNSFCFNTASTIVINAVKTVPISQMDGQRILFDIKDLIKDIVDNVKTLDKDEFGLSFAGVEISSMRHEYLYSRLYMS
ncbi:urease accessory protein UreF [Campylobacter pinnipediorum]|uniref:urease accessory protein UreF n=1 Tax=Campylobacter pinnipediorum TaxID=1965231 RepID=UPI001D058018|nr:urease accessory UreF family protein [Campylobacter pinnipediorum]